MNPMAFARAVMQKARLPPAVLAAYAPAGTADSKKSASVASVEEWEKWLKNGRREGAARVLAGVKAVPYSQLATRRIGQRAPKKGQDKGGTFGATALHHAVLHDAKLDVINKLLDHGADINARNDSGETVLIAAAGFGEAAAVRVLLQRGADPTLGICAVDHLGKRTGEGPGRTALAEALRHQAAEWKEVALALLERGGACMKGGWDGPWENGEDDGEDESAEKLEDFEDDFGAEFWERITKAKKVKRKRQAPGDEAEAAKANKKQKRESGEEKKRLEGREEAAKAEKPPPQPQPKKPSFSIFGKTVDDDDGRW